VVGEWQTSAGVEPGASLTNEGVFDKWRAVYRLGEVAVRSSHTLGKLTKKESSRDEFLVASGTTTVNWKTGGCSTPTKTGYQSTVKNNALRLPTKQQ